MCRACSFPPTRLTPSSASSSANTRSAPRRSPRLRASKSIVDDSEQVAVVALRADRLDRGRGHPGLSAHCRDEAAGALYGGVATRRVDDRAVAHDVVDDYHRAGTG